jgi:predicted glycosyltransferase
MPEGTRRGLHKIADRRGDLIVLDFVPEPACLIERADRVVSMGGYNTTCEILSYSKTALIVPRVRPRQEQWLRASRLRELGVIDMLHPDLLSPDAVGAWLACTSPCSPAGRQRIDIDGMQRIPELLEEMRASVNARRTRPAARDWSETC